MDVTSSDGTPIAYETAGAGAPLVIVNGALSTRSGEAQAELVGLLAPHFTVYGYDRRGRGDSGDTAPYAVEREIGDIEALIEKAGGTAFLFGHSSGGSLTLLAAEALGASRVSRVAAYEAPWNDDPAAQRAWARYRTELDETLAGGRGGDAVALFLRHVGTPAEQVDGMRRAPFWTDFEGLAPTLRYDAEILGATGAVPAGLLSGVNSPTLALCGDASLPFMCVTARAIGRAVPGAEVVTLEGQSHAAQPAVLAPELIRFFGAEGRSTRAA